MHNFFEIKLIISKTIFGIVNGVRYGEYIDFITNSFVCAQSTSY